MIRTEIHSPDKYVIRDDQTAASYHGFDQEWYGTKWQRMAGCGPTVAATILYYLDPAHAGIPADRAPLKSECIAVMESMWKYVTPSFGGVNSTKMLYQGVLEYAKAKKLNIRFDFIDVSKKVNQRPEFGQLLAFLGDALNNDAPVAFLNLNNGEEHVLDAWHWVTMISLEYEEDASFASAEILDEGRVKKIDLLKWFRTTTLGGGFVCFHLS